MPSLFAPPFLLNWRSSLNCWNPYFQCTHVSYSQSLFIFSFCVRLSKRTLFTSLHCTSFKNPHVLYSELFRCYFCLCTWSCGKSPFSGVTFHWGRRKRRRLFWLAFGAVRHCQGRRGCVAPGSSYTWLWPLVRTSPRECRGWSMSMPSREHLVIFSLRRKGRLPPQVRRHIENDPERFGKAYQSHYNG